ncbi:uncharacterized protein LOC109858880 [Pseudomyrmex gracilis]|uniref:uncharacterized protein LOC109858880 n=1 Tax=Pseudomyrmex gracilis TaxID=219809 RepID=UPI0009955B46|nr:uncharacterized protein LOC109858880 [Pseudomyrmex gracilis]
MFSLVVITVLASIVSVQCGTILTPVVGKLVSERVVESHGNNVVHASAPLVATAPALLKYADVAVLQPQPAVVAKAALVAEKTIEAHGHHIVHNAQPLAAVESHVAIPAIAAREITYASPVYYSAYPHQLVAEKTVSSYGHSIQHIA